MFEDEFAGKSAKKRADEAKARRLRAKREKEAKEARKRKELERQAAAAAVAPSDSNLEKAGTGASGTIEDTTEVGKKCIPTTDSGLGDHYVPKFSSNTSKSDLPVISSADDNDSSKLSSEPLTATQKATEQRKIRAEARARVCSSILIQSFVRSKLTALKTREEQRTLFDKRISDLLALSAILKRSALTQQQQSTTSSSSTPAKVADYVPPPATVTIMTTQFLSFACPATIRKSKSGQVAIDRGSMILEERDLVRWTKLLRHVLFPGVSSDNFDLDPLLPWMETDVGRRRLCKVVELCVSSVCRRKKQAIVAKPTSKNGSVEKENSSGAYSTVDAFLRTILRLGSGSEGSASLYVGSTRDNVYQKCRSLLMQSSTPISSDQTKIQTQYKGCDLIYSLRILMLFGSNGNSNPIPPDAGRLRENCISKDEKERISLVMGWVVDFIASTEYDGSDLMAQAIFCSRFMTEVLTVPLLTWKAKSSSYERVLSNQWREAKLGSKSFPPLIAYIHHFINLNAVEISDGRVDVALNMSDVSLSLCPAPAVLALLANLIQLGTRCGVINGTSPTKFHYKAAAEFFNFLATLINAAPLGTFSSRMSAVEWVSIGSSSTPIVLSDVVIGQASTLLADSYVRSLFNIAIDDEALDTQKVINIKTEKDKKHEKDLADLGSTSAASVAAKEAMVDRSRSFWQSSKWAKKLTQSMNNLISGSAEKIQSKPSISSKGVGQLMNTSSIARQLANGKGSINRTVTNAVLTSETESANRSDDGQTKNERLHEYSIFFFFSLCRVYGTIISKWGGNGKEDLVKRAAIGKGESLKQAREYATGTLEPCVTSLLSVLSFSTSLVSSSWAVVQSHPRVVSDLYAVIDVNKRSAPIRTLDSLPRYKRLQHSHHGSSDGNIGAVVLHLFISCLSHTLMVTDDVEIHEMEKPLPMHQLRRCILLLKKLLYRSCCLDDVHEATKGDGNSSLMESNHLGLALISVSSKVMNELYSRSSRRRICVPKLWIEEDLLEKDLRRCKNYQDFTALLSSPVCRICPFLISFKRRLKLFERIVSTNRVDIQGSNELRNLKPGIMVKVSRGRVLEDGLIHLNNLGRNMRQRIVVSYLSQAGAKETGVDVGGLFKEFWTDLSNMAFDPNYALFRVTEGSDGLMYPNPSSKLAHGNDHIVLFEFLGRILGKALYEGITIQPQFAHLFLSFLKGDHQYLHLLTDLGTIDPQLYNNLMFLKNYDGDASDLCLTFTVANDDFGVNEVPLIANGSEIEVTNSNKRRYIYLVAKHHVCDRIKEQADAFTRGLWEVIDRNWLRLFNEPELQVLISGASDGKIDVYDMKSNTRYTGGYTMLDRNVVRFWNVVSSFEPKQQADLLRFVTSCERPPPLGFASMNPPFTIQRVGIMRDGDKLPTASTCFNTLKLPTYSSEKVLKDRLLYAIQAGAGFELT